MDNEITAIDLIRLLSGIVSPKDAIDRLALINALARYLIGIADEGFVTRLVENLGFVLIPEPAKAF